MNDSKDTTETENLMTMARLNSRGLRFTPAERAKGRFMRSPDGHDAGADAGGGSGDAAASASEQTERPGEGGAPLDDAAAAPGGDAAAPGAEGGDPLDKPGLLDGAEKAASEAKAGEDGKSGEDGKGDDAAPLVGEAPEAYELTPPEGFTIDKEAMEIFDPVFRKLGLTKEGAQEVANAAPAFVEHVTNRVQDAQLQQIMDTRKQWADASLSDPEIGGKNLERSLQLSAAVFDRYGLKADGPFRTLLSETGLANHPDMIRVFAKIGNDISEDGFTVGEGAPKPAQSRVERMYPNDVPAGTQ